MEDYAAKMALKTEAALRAYVTGYAQYREAAVLAAFDELRRRGQPAPEEETLRPALAVAAAEQQAVAQATAAAAAAAVPADTDAETGLPLGPPLYSLGIVISLSLVSMLAGAVLVGLNLLRLRQWLGLLSLAGFVLVYLLVIGPFAAGLLQQFGALAGLLFNLPALLVYALWYWPRYFSAARHPQRSWVMPFLLFFGLLYGTYYLMQQPAIRQELEKSMPR